ncbi:MAG TPA: hypothetical protein VIM69_04010 [Opitutaceae bacterium]
MEDTQIKDSLIALLNGIKNSDGVVIAREMELLDQAVTPARPGMHPQLEHFLQRRSYAKALAFLGGEEVPANPNCTSRRAPSSL